MRPVGASAASATGCGPPSPPTTTVYAIRAGRGFDDAQAVLGADFDGVLVRDGWVVYRSYTNGEHQSCLQHLRRRCEELLEDHPHCGWAAQVQDTLQAALALRDRRNAGGISDHGLATVRHRQQRRAAMLERSLSEHLTGSIGYAHLMLLRTPVDTNEPTCLQPDLLVWRIERARHRCLSVPVPALSGANSPRGVPSMAGCRGTSPYEVLDAQGDFGSSRQPAPTSRDQPRKVSYKVQGDERHHAWHRSRCAPWWSTSRAVSAVACADPAPAPYRPFSGDILAQRPCLCTPRIAASVRPRGRAGSLIEVQRLRPESGRAVCRRMVNPAAADRLGCL